MSHMPTFLFSELCPAVSFSNCIAIRDLIVCLLHFPKTILTGRNQAARSQELKVGYSLVVALHRLGISIKNKSVSGLPSHRPLYLRKTVDCTGSSSQPAIGSSYRLRRQCQIYSRAARTDTVSPWQRCLGAAECLRLAYVPTPTTGRIRPDHPSGRRPSRDGRTSA